MEGKEAGRLQDITRAWRKESGDTIPGSPKKSFSLPLPLTPYIHRVGSAGRVWPGWMGLKKSSAKRIKRRGCEISAEDSAEDSADRTRDPIGSSAI